MHGKAGVQRARSRGAASEVRTDAMRVLLDGPWHVEVDDLSHVLAMRSWAELNRGTYVQKGKMRKKKGREGKERRRVGGGVVSDTAWKPNSIQAVHAMHFEGRKWRS